MRRIHKLLFLLSISLVFVLASCNKDKPMVGQYMVTFRSTSPLPETRSIFVDITSVNRTKVTINGFELRKSGRVIDGEFESDEVPNSVFKIDGSWNKTAFRQEYSIIGRFTEQYTIGGNEYESSGTFEMTSVE